MEAFKDTLPIVCNGFKRDNVITINRAWNRSASFRLVTENNTPHDKVVLPLLLHT